MTQRSNLIWADMFLARGQGESKGCEAGTIPVIFREPQ